MRTSRSAGPPWAAALLLLVGLRVSGAAFAAAAPAAAAALAGAPDTEVVLVHAVFRHGARTPVDTYPADPHINATLWPVGWGQLTNEGKQQQFAQGEWLRARYDALLGPLYSPALLEARATDKDRTLMSAQLELAGLWPPQGSQRWHPTLQWQPVPVHTAPVRSDHLLLGYSPCPGFFEKRDAVLASDAVREQLAALGVPALYDALANLTGMAFATPDDVQSLYSTLKAEEGFGLELQPSILEYYPKKLEEITALSFVYNAYDKDLQIIQSGHLLKTILEHSEKKINNTLSQKMYLYAAHDSTVVNLMKSLGVWDTQVPAYGIMSLVELHREKESGNYGIMTTYLWTGVLQVKEERIFHRAVLGSLQDDENAAGPRTQNTRNRAHSPRPTNSTRIIKKISIAYIIHHQKFEDITSLPSFYHLRLPVHIHTHYQPSRSADPIP